MTMMTAAEMANIDDGEDDERTYRPMLVYHVISEGKSHYSKFPLVKECFFELQELIKGNDSFNRQYSPM